MQTAIKSSPDAAAEPVKLIVAVHGIGDQIGYATVQSVVVRIGAYFGVAPVLPLGRFYPIPSAKELHGKSEARALADLQPSPVLMNPPDPAELCNLGFAEVYWAPIARRVVERKYVLEEAKKWARSIAARVAYRGIKDHGWTERDVDRLVAALDELTESVFVLERLTYVANKAGMFKFELGRLLLDFVGDVQIVGDFEGYRQQILDAFDDVVTRTQALTDRPRELYIVAHSEGSVVAFLALLHALHDPGRYPWIHEVRGLMTIGSPIEVHHLLWPELWTQPRLPQKPLRASSKLSSSAPSGRPPAIEWHNYLDHGDPIAYELIATQQWMEQEDVGFARYLKLTEHAFSRSHLPGKAHVDYWDDDQVFGHFLENVVGVRAARRADAPCCEPKNRHLARLSTWLVPQLLVAGLLMLAVYVLYRGVGAAIPSLAQGQTTFTVLRDVVGLGLLMLGVTAAARIPRIMDRSWWALLSVALLLLSMVVQAHVTCPATTLALGSHLAARLPLPELMTPAHWPSNVLPCSRELTAAEQMVLSESVSLIWLLAAIVAAAAGLAARFYPKFGHYVLPALGVAATGLMIAFIFTEGGTDTTTAVWPAIVAGVVFFYVWWLSALLFDLVFVWQRYVRGAAVRTHLQRLAPSVVRSNRSFSPDVRYDESKTMKKERV